MFSRRSLLCGLFTLPVVAFSKLEVPKKVFTETEAQQMAKALSEKLAHHIADLVPKMVEKMTERLAK